MKNAALTLLLACLAAPALAAETLPDSASTAVDDSADMANRFGAPAMDPAEMEQTYLESPALVENTETRSMKALTDEERYTETDLRFREQLLRSQDTITISPPKPPGQDANNPPPPATQTPVPLL